MKVAPALVQVVVAVAVAVVVFVVVLVAGQPFHLAPLPFLRAPLWLCSASPTTDSLSQRNTTHKERAKYSIRLPLGDDSKRFFSSRFVSFGLARAYHFATGSHVCFWRALVQGETNRNVRVEVRRFSSCAVGEQAKRKLTAPPPPHRVSNCVTLSFSLALVSRALQFDHCNCLTNDLDLGQRARSRPASQLTTCRTEAQSASGCVGRPLVPRVYPCCHSSNHNYNHEHVCVFRGQLLACRRRLDD